MTLFSRVQLTCWFFQLVGVMVSVKPKEDIIQIWNKDNEDNESVKDELGLAWKHVCSVACYCNDETFPSGLYKWQQKYLI